MAATEPIPEPRGYPLIGHIGEFVVDTGRMVTINRLVDTYGPIFRLRIGASETQVFVASNEFVNEICDERRFRKVPNGVLGQVREGIKDGLFTAYLDEPNWGKAHRILVPAFGPLSIRNMFDEMHDISSQMCMKFARLGPENPINAADDFTRLALDTIALTSMDFRFNSFYRDEMHPFVQAMTDFLTEAGIRSTRSSLVPSFLYRKDTEAFYQNIGVMESTAAGIVAHRKEHPSDRKDLLNAMLHGVDPQTKEKLPDENIAHQLVTFLIAGHETTSGMLSFTMCLLIKNPEAYQKVQREVDEVVGDGPITIEHLGKLKYVAATLRESLRLRSTIPVFTVNSLEDTVLGGKYPVKKGESISAVLTRANLDPVVYGDDAKEFKPERMLDDEFASREKEFPNSWKAFGNGQRACIGRPLAWQEGLLAMALMFQNFNFSMDDPSYQLAIKESLTLKTDGFKMRATLRNGMTPIDLEKRLGGRNTSNYDISGPKLSHQAAPASAESGGVPQKPIAVFYGSNSGTCEALAQRLAADASKHGFTATTVSTLDDAKGNVPKDRPVVVVTSSYEGQPPDNAGHFIHWMQSLNGQEMEGVSYAVFGCGHKDWAKTFHRIPKLVDSKLETLGGRRLVEMGSADASCSDMFGDFEAWEDRFVWPALKEKYNVDQDGEATADSLHVGISVDVSTPRKATLRQDVEEAMVCSTKTLTKSGPVKNHIEIKLPSGMTYNSGDYLAVLPMNPKENVARVLRHFQLPWDATLTIRSNGPTTLPTDTAIWASDIFGAYVELAQPATKRNVTALMDATKDESAVVELRDLAGDSYKEEILAKKVSILDLLERYPSIHIPVSSYLGMLPPMRVRRYSISSSPLADPTKVTLTYSVLDEPSLSGHGRHVGVATNFLSHLTQGEKLHVAVRPSHKAFHLPSNAESTPIVMIGAGSGIAPFRGFIQERATMISAGRKVAPAILFYGCRAPDMDDVYSEELAQWEALGAVDVRRAYSRATDKADGHRYVQDRLYHDRKDVLKLWDEGANIYVCGSREVGRQVEQTCAKLSEEWASENGGEKTKEWLEDQLNERFATDVFE